MRIHKSIIRELPNCNSEFDHLKTSEPQFAIRSSKSLQLTMVRRGAPGAVRRCLGGLLSPPSRLLDGIFPRQLEQFGNEVLRRPLDRRPNRYGALGTGFARQLMTGLSGNEENWVQSKISAFKRGLPVEEAETPPSSWYTSPEILNLELEKIFERRWLALGRVEQLQSHGDFFTGKVGRVRYVVCMDEEGIVRAFHNVCRHHAAAVARGSGCTSSFVCPYHGWTYALDGKLLKASRLGGIKNFSAKNNGLSPLRASTWGPFVLISSLSENTSSRTEAKGLLGNITKTYNAEKEWLGSAAKVLAHAKIDSSLRYITTREYTLNCNWKVFCDNYLDGGYHVPYGHRNLASDLNLTSYCTEISEKVSIQSCKAAKTNADAERLGESATYAFVYPNFMINRYGPWMDTNLVLPVTATQCRVIFDYFLESSYPHDESFIKESLECSDIVQHEDIALCESVQEGLRSPSYDIGRYAPNVEHAMFHFHTLLHDDLCEGSGTFGGLNVEDLQQDTLRHPLT